MKNLKIILAAIICATTLTACNSVVGGNSIDDNGNPEGKLAWPDPKDVTWQEGTFPTFDEIDMIQKNLTRTQLKKLFEHPQFAETFRAREWNYLFNFNMSDGSIKQCQFKVLFDKNRLAQNFYWKPADCLVEDIDLKSDSLFAFDKSGINDMKEAGKRELDKIAEFILKNGNRLQLDVVGHTDYLGDDAYNQGLSERRAATVVQYLVSRGVNSANLKASGMGETKPIKQCNSGMERNALKDCLQPNRRVSLQIKRFGKGKIVWHDINLDYAEMRSKIEQ